MHTLNCRNWVLGFAFAVLPTFAQPYLSSQANANGKFDGSFDSTQLVHVENSAAPVFASASAQAEYWRLSILATFSNTSYLQGDGNNQNSSGTAAFRDFIRFTAPISARYLKADVILAGSTATGGSTLLYEERKLYVGAVLQTFRGTFEDFLDHEQCGTSLALAGGFGVVPFLEQVSGLHMPTVGRCTISVDVAPGTANIATAEASTFFVARAAYGFASIDFSEGGLRMVNMRLTDKDARVIPFDLKGDSGTYYSHASATVPEPSTLILGLLVSALWLARRLTFR
jgi:hypothetical protein